MNLRKTFKQQEGLDATFHRGEWLKYSKAYSAWLEQRQTDAINYLKSQIADIEHPKLGKSHYDNERLYYLRKLLKILA